MKPIINPLYFYLIDILNTIDVFSLFVLILAMFAFVMTFDETDEIFKKIHKTSFIIGIIFAIISIFIPSRETCYQMMIANYVTSDNIELTKGEVKELVDYIVDSIDKVDENDDSK